MGSVAGAVEEVVGGQVPSLHILVATLTYKSLGHFSTAPLPLDTDPPRAKKVS